MALPVDPTLIAEWMRRQQAMRAPVAGPPSLDDLQALAPDASAAPPTAPPAAAAPEANPMAALMRQYMTAYSPGGLRKAQEEDQGGLERSHFADVMNQWTALHTGSAPVQTRPLPPMAAAQFGQRQELAGRNLGMVGQMMAMQPDSRLSTLKRLAFAATPAGQQLLRAAGPGYDSLSSWDLDQYNAALESGLKPSEALATITEKTASARKAGADAAVAEAGLAGVSPEVAAALKRQGVEVPTGVPIAIAEKLVGPQVQRLEGGANRANAIALKNKEIEQWYAQNKGQNPTEIAPGLHYRGPKVFPTDEDRKPVMDVYVPGVETIKNLDAYQAHWEKAAKNPALLASPGWRQEGETLYQSTFPGIARKNAGGSAPPLAEIGSAQEALAKPGVGSQIIGTALPKVRASVKALRDITKRDIKHVGEAHNIDVTEGALEGRPGMRRVTDGTQAGWAPESSPLPPGWREVR